MNLPPDPFGRVRLPAEWAAAREAETDRRRRVAMLIEVADALLRGDLPGPEARGFVAGALQAWLAGDGGDLAGDFLRVRPCRGSQATAQAIARQLHNSSDVQHDQDDDAGTELRDDDVIATADTQT